MLQVIQETVDDLINASDDWDEINTIQGGGIPIYPHLRPLNTTLSPLIGCLLCRDE